MKLLIEIGEGFGAGILAIFVFLLIGFIYGPSGAMTRFAAELWRTWRGKRPTTNGGRPPHAL